MIRIFSFTCPHQLFRFILLLAFAESQLAHGNAPVDPQNKLSESSWESTDLNFDFFNENVTTDSCNESESKFLSCISSIRAVLQHNGDGLDVVHRSWQEKPANNTKMLRSFGEARVIKYPRNKNKRLAEVLKQVRDSRARILAWQGIYRSGLSDEIKFTKMREWLLSAVVDYDRRSSYAAAAINGYISAQDSHAQIMPARLLYGQTAQGQNRYSGIGVSLQKVGNTVLVGRVLKDGPAFKVGMRSLDELHSVDGEEVKGKKLEDVVAALRGPKRSGVVVKAKRHGKIHRFLIIRGEVEIKNVSYELLPDRGQRWGYIRIETFTSNATCRQVRYALTKSKASKITGLILDLRDNMGGLVAQAACVADLFLKPDLVVLEMRSLNGDSHNEVVRTRHPMFSDTLMVTLVNANSGSASEILAGALQDHQRSFIAGAQTFGKGSIQVSRPWNATGSVVQLFTAARYYLPSGRTIQFTGITPDLNVFETPETRSQDLLALREIDLFPNALAFADSTWIQPRRTQVETVTNCAGHLGLAEYRMLETDDTSKRLDYPLYYAQDALICMYINQIS